MTSCVAIDLGATSGRVIVGSLRDDKVSLKLVSRFPNQPVIDGDEIRWNVTGLYEEALAGLRTIVTSGASISSIGIDSWAVDYGLMSDGNLIAEPRHYRDPRTEQGVDAVHALVGHDQLFVRNGLQFLPFNTLYQLAADAESGVLAEADQLLLIPDLLAYWLTGVAVGEETNASTTGLLPSSNLAWDESLLATLGLPAGLFPPLVRPGDRIGVLRHDTAKLISAPEPIPVTAVGSHDTASAVVAVPMDPTNSAYVSCGTWGLVGVEVAEPILSTEARVANFTNERGVDGTTRLLRNVMGLWLLSECLREWEGSGLSVELESLLEEAAALMPPEGLIDVNDSSFLAPGAMSHRIADHLRHRDLPIPKSPAETTRLILESLATAFAATAASAAQLTGIVLEHVHIVGGGAQNALLCQLLADRSGVEVIAGPVEATSMGNVLVQLRGAGNLTGGLESMRAVVRSSCDLTRYTPSGGSR